DEVSDLGAYRFYFTGGEPFVRKDIFELIEYITQNKKAELIILTNATLFRGERLDRLKRQDRERLKFQISLDGSTPAINDPIRGEGAFRLITEGQKTVSDLGFKTSLTAAVTGTNLRDMVNLPALAQSLGAKSLHLMWLHRRGRALDLFKELFPTHDQLLQLAREVKKRSEALGIVFDNYESLKLRVNGRPGVKFDLGNACWDSLCLYSDGHLYPSASFAGYAPLDMGDATARSVKALWLESPVARRFRSASVINKAGVDGDAYRFITGGGDIEHSYFLSESRNGTGAGTILSEDPYYPLYREMIQDVMLDLARKKRMAFNTRSGFSAPMIYHAMGEGGMVCGTGEELIGDPAVGTLHSNCVLSFDVEKPYKIVQEFYGKAAEKPQPELCCPVHYEADEISHIPAEVLQRFYGCGSPMALGGVRAGEVVVDLGSGGGIDCFIAAKKTGPEGKVIGVDMTEEMLTVANRNKMFVAENLGYHVVEFRKGYLERMPVEDRSADLITSNCVINLSPDKQAVFAEMWRVLKDNGRIVISDIVTEAPVPSSIRANEQLWGECLSGALTEEEFVSGLERAGFYGLELLKKSYWKEVEGHRFHSVTVRGYKYEKKEGCIYIGQRAIYRGPFKAVMDEEGHLFPRNEAVEVCTDTAAKVSSAPYAAHFTVAEPDQKTSTSSVEPIVETEQAAAAAGDKNACGPGCC
ncbi:MAG: methyltransferase domain-containing protein, partial [Nitrospirota bacterium]